MLRIGSDGSFGFGYAASQSAWTTHMRAYNRDNGAYSMTSEDQDHIAELVKQIEVETDQHKFIQLVEELNDLLDDVKSIG